MNRLNLQRQSAGSDQCIKFIPPANGGIVEIFETVIPITMRFDAHFVKRCCNLWHRRAGLPAKSSYMNHRQPKCRGGEISLEHSIHNAFAPISHCAIQKSGGPEDLVHFAVLLLFDD